MVFLMAGYDHVIFYDDHRMIMASSMTTMTNTSWNSYYPLMISMKYHNLTMSYHDRHIQRWRSTPGSFKILQKIVNLVSFLQALKFFQ